MRPACSIPCFFRMNRIYAFIFLCGVLCAPAVSAEYTVPETWGLVFTLRSARLPYATDDKTVNDILPFLFYYDDGRLFIDGLSIGYKAINNQQWQLSALGRYRFFDIPGEYQSESRGNAFDFGAQLKYRFGPQFNMDLELMNDQHARYHANLVANYLREEGNWRFHPFARLRWKDARFNNHYYGLDVDTPGSGFDFSAGAEVRYNMYKNFYLVARASATVLDEKTYQSSTIDSRSESVAYLGVGFFNDKSKRAHTTLQARPYLRLAYGESTPSSLGEILVFHSEGDPYENRMTSLFYGYPISDELFDLPIAIYLTPGVVYHHPSEVQPAFPEYVLAFKGYYTFKWPTRWRFGFAEGLSYLTHMTYIEQQEMDKNNYRASQLMNYLDVSFDLNLGELFNSRSMQDWWFGYSIHHRSALYETSSMFGNIKGGSNYQTVYLQYHW